MPDTAALVVALSAQISQFEKDMKDAVKIADTNTKAIETRFAKMNDEISSQLKGLGQVGLGRLGPLGGIIGSLGPAGLALGVGIGAAALAFDHLAQSTQKYIEQASQLKNAAETTGLTITELDELNKVGLGVGVSAEAVSLSISKMTVAFDQLRHGTGTLYEQLRKYPDVLARITNARDTAEAIDILSEHLHSLGTEFEKNAFLRAAFGRGGVPIGRVLEESIDRGGIRQIAVDSKEAGTAINEGMVKEVDKLEGQLKSLQKTGDDLWGETFGSLILKAQINFKEFDNELARDVKEKFEAAKGYVKDFFDALETERQKAARSPAEPFPQATRALGIGPQPQFTRRTVPDVQALTTGEEPPLPPSRPEVLTLTIEQRIRKLKDYIAVMGDVADLTKKLELRELELDKAMKEDTKNFSAADIARKKNVDAIDSMIEAQQRIIAAQGQEVDKTDTLHLAELQLQRARAAGNITTERSNQVEGERNDRRRLEILSVKEAAQTITEQETAERNLLQVKIQAQREGVKLTETTNLEILAHKRAKEAIEAREAELSRLPQTTRYAQEAMNGWKNADQFLTQFAGNFESAMGDIATGSKTAAEAFKSLTDSIIRDLIRITIRMSVTGPLLKSLGAFFPGFSGGAGITTGPEISPTASGNFFRQGGGPVFSGTPYVVGEHGAELFVPHTSGQIIPANVFGGKTGGGTTVEVNNYVAADTDTKQNNQQGPNGERIIIDIVKKAQARGELDDTNRGRFGLRPNKVR